ncbi:hypothetical protein BJX70DRAFT_386462 [Aspergillus crustosus]
MSDYDSPEPPPKPELKHTMTELEDNVMNIMVKAAKVDACIDLFLHRLIPFEPWKENSSGYHSWEYNAHGWDFQRATKSLPEETKKELEEELQKNLVGLVPEYLGDGTKKLENSRSFNERFRRRWDVLIPRRGSKKHKDEPNSVPASLLNTLAERQYKAGAGLLEVPSAEAREAFNESCRELRSVIEGERAAASFSVGDSVSSPPVNVFWSKGDDSVAHKLVLPVNGSVSEASNETRQCLVTACEPASFGRGEKDVLDPEYRRAGKINVNQFATSFHPADFGILENIGQVLLPSISSESDNQLGFRKIKAELYKLNVYSGPLGHFRKHVDTPRAANQIGSLVVCLPSAFKGGNLNIEHHGQKSIQWAAFYSDCEHEIKTITEGDCIILTYNLYVTEPVGGAIPSPASIVDPKTLPIPRTNSTQLPRSLQGSDLVVYSVFKSLGINTEVLPIIESDERYYLGQWYTTSPLHAYLHSGTEIGVPSYNELLPSSGSGDEYEDLDRRWKTLLLSRKVLGMQETVNFAKAENLPLKENSVYNAAGVQIGASRYAYDAHSRGEEQDLDHVVRDIWPAYYVPGITWVTEPKHEKMAFSQLTYGNEASIGIRYSCAAILAVIPPAEKRAGILG